MLNATANLSTPTEQVTVREKLGEPLRRRVNNALTLGEPISIRRVYIEQSLALRGIPLSSFYRYARRVRARCAIQSDGEESPPDAVAATDAIRRSILFRVLDLIDDEGTTPAVIRSLISSLRSAVATHADLKRQVAEATQQSAAQPQLAARPEPPNRQLRGSWATREDLEMIRAIREESRARLDPGAKTPLEPNSGGPR